MPHNENKAADRWPHMIRYAGISGKLDTLPRACASSWADFVRNLADVEPREQKDGAAYIPAVFREPRRSDECVEYVTAMVLDLDGKHGSMTREQIEALLRGYAFVAHTTYSSTPAYLRWRIVIPYARRVTAVEHRAAFDHMQARFGGALDPACKNASHFFYAPSCPPQSTGDFQHFSGQGEPLDPASFAYLQPRAQGCVSADTVQVSQLRVSEEIKSLIVEGKAKGRRSEAVWRAIRAMVKAGHTDDEIRAILLNPAYKLSEKPVELGAVWLDGEIRRARCKPDANEAATGAERADSSQEVVCLADVEPEEVDWLWHPYIPLGKVTSIEGDPGLGKSWMLMAILAALSKGEALFGTSGSDPATCLLVSAEDGLADTIRPRLDGLGADSRRIHAFAKTPVADEDGLAKLERHIQRLSPKIVVIDPLVAYMGGKMDINKANQTRAIMSGLAALAEKYSCAIVVLRHLSKGPQDKAIYRGIGSIDITAACRSVLLVAVDPHDLDKCVVAHIKSNLAAKGDPFGFAIKDDCFRWEGKVDVTPEEMLAPDADNADRRREREVAEDFLREHLAAGRVAVNEIEALAEQQGIANSTLGRAKRHLGVRSRKDGQAWFWELPKKGTE
jgi:archaellum biogenesis ATPase FlaH